jgi:hypothetical protein
VNRVLEGHRAVGGHTQPGQRQQIDVRGRLDGADLVTAGQELEAVEVADARQVVLDPVAG